MELLAHLEAQIKAKEAAVTLSNVSKQSFIKGLHKSYYDGLPESFLTVKDKDGDDVVDDENRPLLVRPGEYRDHPIQVGTHIPPVSKELNGYMAWLEKQFDPEKIHRTDRLIAAAALHHRLFWIHPFQDGNGRVLRLLTDCYIRALDLVVMVYGQLLAVLAETQRLITQHYLRPINQDRGTRTAGEFYRTRSLFTSQNTLLILHLIR